MQWFLVPTCTDGMTNELETDLDCGGATCVSQGKACGIGLKCDNDTDCTSGMCNIGICVG